MDLETHQNIKMLLGIGWLILFSLVVIIFLLVVITFQLK